MRKLTAVPALLLFVLFASPLTVHAQSTEIFGGYSYVHFDTSPGSTNFNGWNASLTENMFKVFGVTGDFGGTYGSPGGVKSSMNTFLFGPQLHLPTPFVTPFVHALFGAARFSAAGTSSTAFASALGGGIDVHPFPIVGLRLIQADYLTTHFGNTHQNDLRLSAGIVLRF
ncbi:MAG TPA: hypothetical protein VNF02_05275 [Candidatus Limnocylindrales bacterium]|nr:hypothetical protein [Candidatus Limnocylindrales bacterium]